MSNDQMVFIDLFAGIGGFRSGMERNNLKAIAFSEIDKYASLSYKSIYDTKGEVELGDITKISDTYWQEFEDVDFIVGGSPCQAFSLAGKRLGFEDTRGTLFFDYANAIKQVKPKYFLFENVKGLVSHDKGNTVRIILKTFDELGYDVDFDIFNSKYYGVPQNRERIYIIGKRKDLGANEPKTALKGKKIFEKLTQWASENVSYVNLLPDNTSTYIEKYLSDILEEHVEESFYLSEEVLKSLLYKPKEQNEDRFHIKEATKKGYAEAELGDSVTTIYPNSKTRRGRVGKKMAHSLQAGDTLGVVIDKKYNFYTKDNVLYDEEQYINLPDRFEPDYIYVEPTIKVIDEDHILLINSNDEQYEVLKIEDGYYLSLQVSHNLKDVIQYVPKEQYGRLGRQASETMNENIDLIKDGMSINAYNRTLNQTGISPTVTTRPEGFKTAILPITSDLRIRKLTPLECWRLQGFEDEQFYKAQQGGVSNSQLYKQAGNAVTVNVVEAIIKHFIENKL